LQFANNSSPPLGAVFHLRRYRTLKVVCPFSRMPGAFPRGPVDLAVLVSILDQYMYMYRVFSDSSL